MMIKRFAVAVLALGIFAACGGGTPEPTSPSTTASPSGSTDNAIATKPDRAKVITHLKEHVKYPVSRADLLKACADTPEFTAGEKKWFETNLPDATYKSADDVVAAVTP